MRDLETTLSPYQREGRDFALANPRCLILDPPGLGKTLQAIGLIEALRLRGGLARVLVAVDSNILSRQWAGELAKYLPTVPAFEANAGGKVFHAFQRTKGPVIWLTTYAMLHSRRQWADHFRWSLVVYDEVSVLKGANSQQQTARTVSRRSERALGLTATELENDGCDTWAILDAVGTPGLWSKPVFDDRFIEWAPAYTTPGGQYVPAQATGLRQAHLPELRNYVGHYTIRRTEQEAGLTLPQRVGADVVWLPPSREQVGSLARAGRLDAGRYRHQQMDIASAFTEGSSAKASAALEWTRQRPHHEKLLIFAEHLEHLDIMESLLVEAGIGNVRLEGGVAQKKRLGLIDRFRADPSVRVVLGSRVLERGLDELKAASALLSLGCSWNPGREAQREGRIRRRGSLHQEYEHVTFMLDHPHDRAKWQKLVEKRAQADALRGTTAYAGQQMERIG